MNHLENDLSNEQVLLNSDQSFWPGTTSANALNISLLACETRPRPSPCLCRRFLAHLVSSPVRRARTVVRMECAAMMCNCLMLECHVWCDPRVCKSSSVSSHSVWRLHSHIHELLLLTTPSLSLLNSVQCVSPARVASQPRPPRGPSRARRLLSVLLSASSSRHEESVSIRVLVAREKELHIRFEQLKRRLLSLLRNLHAPSGYHEWVTAARSSSDRRRTTPPPCKCTSATLSPWTGPFGPQIKCRRSRQCGSAQHRQENHQQA